MTNGRASIHLRPLGKAEMERFNAEFATISNRLIDEGVPLLTAMVVAGDIQSAKRADELMAIGVRPQDVVWSIGSFARFKWAHKNLPRGLFFSLLPQLWVASDPDDTKPECLTVWREAWRRNKNLTITDGRRLPSGLITIFRGQVGKIGISWTLDREVAKRFAKTGGGRDFIGGGMVLRHRIHSSQVLAYLTRRNESEVIIDYESLNGSAYHL